MLLILSVSMGNDGISLIIETSTTCSAIPGDPVYRIPDTRAVEYFSDNQEKFSNAQTYLYLLSNAPIESSTGIFKLEIKFRDEIKYSQCYSYGVSATFIQSDFNNMFDYNDDGVIDEEDKDHNLISREEKGDKSSAYGNTSLFYSSGSKSRPGNSRVLRSNAPKINVFGIGKSAGCSRC